MPRRVTLMIGFWTRDVGAPLTGLKREPLSACAPTPRVTRACSWPATLVLPQATTLALPATGKPATGAPAAVAAGAAAELRRHTVTEVRPAWEEVPPAGPPRAAAAAAAARRNDQEAIGVAVVARRGGGRDRPVSTTPYSVAEDAWAGQGLCVPEERNNHYFVRGMDEFVFEHLPKATPTDDHDA